MPSSLADMVNITAIMKPIDREIETGQFEFVKPADQVRNATRLAVAKGLRNIFEKNLVGNNKQKRDNARKRN